MLRFLAALGCVLTVSGPAAAADHVRIVLDVSRSMLQNDKPRLATLAAMLLHDLAEPNPPLGDTFVVIPFHRSVAWKSPADPPPTDVGGRIVSQGNRNAFVSALNGLRYDADTTYFYPGLRAAITDFESLASVPSDNRVVILITDGVPLASTQSREEELIRDELLPRYRKVGVKLYLLAFGNAANADQALFKRLISADLGDVFVDPTGANLLDYMIEIFSRSFGFTAAPPASLPPSGATTLDLEGGQAASRVAIVAYRRDSSIPQIQVDPTPNAPGGVRRAQETGASYWMQWVLDPVPGSYRLQADPLGGFLAVLRPTRLQIEIGPAASGARHDLAIARTPLPLTLVVSPASGPRGDPGADLNVSFRVCGPRQGQGFAWCEPHVGAGVGTKRPDGRAYRIDPVFQRDPGPPQEFYSGNLEVTVLRREAVVGAIEGDRAHRITVYPFVRLRVLPPTSDIVVDGAVRDMTRGENGCASFTFEPVGTLPHPARPQYNLRAVLDPALTGDRRFAGAVFTLDGRSIDVPTPASPVPAAWTSGQPVTQAELTSSHELCVQLGNPRAGGGPIAVPVHFTLLEQPWEGSPIIDSFTANARVASPGWLERWGAVLALSAIAIVAAALWWYGRDRPYVPRDLRVAVGTSEAHLEPRSLATGSLLRTLAGVNVWRVVNVDPDVRLGWIRPLTEELYDFYSARGVQVEQLENRRLGRMTVRHPYSAKTGAGVTYWFSVEYE